MRSTLCTLLAAVAVCAAAGEVRTWTNREDGTRIEAQLVNIEGDRVRLARGAKVYAVPLWRLSDADLAYLADHALADELRAAYSAECSIWYTLPVRGGQWTPARLRVGQVLGDSMVLALWDGATIAIEMDARDLVDGDVCTVRLVEVGRYQYTGTSGALATVRKYAGLEPLTPANFAAAIAAGYWRQMPPPFSAAYQTVMRLLAAETAATAD